MDVYFLLTMNILRMCDLKGTKDCPFCIHECMCHFEVDADEPIDDFDDDAVPGFDADEPVSDADEPVSDAADASSDDMC